MLLGSSACDFYLHLGLQESNLSMMRKCHMGIRLGGEHPGHLGRDRAIMAGSRAGGQIVMRFRCLA